MLHLDADSGRALEEHPSHEGVALHAEVGTVAVGVEVGHGGVDAHAVDRVERDEAVARPLGVHIDLLGEAELGAGGEEGAGNGPRVGRTPHRDGPVAAMAILIAEVEVLLQPLEERQHLVVRPFGQPRLGQTVEIVPAATHEIGAVDRARPADDLAVRGTTKLMSGVSWPLKVQLSGWPGKVACIDRALSTSGGNSWSRSHVTAGLEEEDRT